MKYLVSIFILFAATYLSATDIINVADYGIVPGKDVTLELSQLLHSLKGKKGQTLSFPKGQYEFYPENAVEKYRAVTNHDNSLKRLAFPLFEMDGITIDGNGSLFMFHGMICPFVLEQSKNTTLKNFSIDFNTPFHDELVVVERDEASNSFVVEIDLDKYKYSIKNGKMIFHHEGFDAEFGQNITFDPKTSAPIWNTRDYLVRVKKNTQVTQLSNNRVRLQNITKVPPPVGAIVATYGNGRGGNRFVPVIHVSSSKNTRIEEVTVYAGGGMALIAERSEDIYLDRFVVTSKTDRCIATRADATHFLGCKGTITLKNCLLEHMLDDGINVHGAYAKIEKYLGNKQFLCEISHFQQAGLIFAKQGDKISLLSRETILPFFESTVEDFQILNAKRMIVTLSDVPTTLPKGLLSMENLTWYPNVILQNNIIRQNRARSALITTKGKVLIEDNYFSSQMHGILIEGDNNKWYESGGVQDITIVNNTFENIGFGNNGAYPLYISPLYRPEQHSGNKKYHRNINFSNNKLISFNGHLVHALSTENLIVKGNTVKVSELYPKGKHIAAISLDYCEDVDIRKNKFSGFDELEVDIKDNSKEVKFKRNKGIR